MYNIFFCLLLKKKPFLLIGCQIKKKNRNLDILDSVERLTGFHKVTVANKGLDRDVGM